MVLAVAGIAVLVAMLAADLGIFLAARSRAQIAADAAALAAAPVTFQPYGASGSPTAEAAAFAAANGADLVECRCDHDGSWRARTVLVAVSIDVPLLLLPDTQVGATSRAEFEPTRLGR
jgi:hypothetical protein